MATYRLAFLATFFLFLAGCMEQSLQLNVRFDRVDGLKAGDPVVFRDRSVGRVDAVEYTRAGVFLVQIRIDADYRAAATTETRFYLAADPARLDRKRIEVEHPGGGQPLVDGATVDGYSRGVLEGVLPLGEIFKGMGEGLREFRNQIEQFQRGLEKLPNSEEAKKLEEEWKRFMEQLDKAGKGAEKELEPRLRELDKRFRQLEPKEPPKPPVPQRPRRRDGYEI